MTEHGQLDGVLDRLVEAAPGATYRRRVDGQQPLETASERWSDLTGYEVDDFGEQSGDGRRGGERGWLDLVHPEDREALREAVSALDPGEGVDATYRIRRRDGDLLWVRERATVNDDPDVVEGVVFDVTEDVEREREHEADAELLDAIFESIPVHLFVKDENGVHVRVSEHLSKGEPFVGKTDPELAVDNPEHARKALEDDIRVIEEGEPIIDKEEYQPELDQWNLTSKVPWENDDGEIVGLIGVSRDITQRKRAQQELRRKTERLEEFADVLSHDIRNPLTVANGHLELARATGEVEHVEEVTAALERADAIIDDVLALSRHGEDDFELEAVSLQTICHGAAHSVSAPRAEIAFPDDVQIRADRSQLRRLLENLFKNAVQHGGADVSIDVSITDSGFAVEDDGPGIPPDEREQVFETSYTTHEDGTGFGLAIVEEIADAHGWTVELTEGTAGGARFEFRDVTKYE